MPLRRNLAPIVTFIAAGALLISGQTPGHAVDRAAAGTLAATVPDFSGLWIHPYVPGFELPVSGPGPVTNRSRIPAGPFKGVGNPNQMVGDYARILDRSVGWIDPALSATWKQFDLTAGVWVKPSSHTKQKQEHRVPISAPARQLLSEMLQDEENAARKENRSVQDNLFPGVDGRAQGELKKYWANVCRSAKLSGVRVHDLRHTYASVLASS